MRWKRMLTVVGVHAEGEYAKVVTGGVVDVPGRTMFDKMQWLAKREDGLRKFLLYEPRGAAVHSANVILPSRNPKAALGYVIMESTEYPPMSGHNTICTVTAILETGILPMREPETHLTLEAPAGLIEVSLPVRGGPGPPGEVPQRSGLRPAPRCARRGRRVGTVTLDVAYGGMHYALVDAARLGFRITPDEARDICTLGEKIRAAAREQLRVVHPENARIRDVTITEFMGPLRRKGRGLTARNTVVVSPGRLDRSPCGTGTSARLAVMHARRQIRRGQPSTTSPSSAATSWPRSSAPRGSDASRR